LRCGLCRAALLRNYMDTTNEINSQALKVAEAIARTMTECDLSMADALVSIMAGIGEMVKALSASIDRDPREMGDFIADGIKLYINNTDKLWEIQKSN